MSFGLASWYLEGVRDARCESRPLASFLARRFAASHRAQGERFHAAYWLGYARAARQL